MSKINIEKFMSNKARRMKASEIRELLKLTEKPDIISFAGGLPAPEVFPVREFEEAARYLLPRYGEKMLQYSTTEGFTPLREFLANYMQKYNVPAEVENIQITTGSQQALDLVGKVFIDEGDYIITSKPTYLGALSAWTPFNPNYLTVSMDDDGMIPEEIEEHLKRHKVKFIYVLPNFHNPAGVTISEERRKKIVELAEKYDTIIIEDDPYGELRFEGKDLTPLITLMKERVIYLSTFSKTLAPGTRIGWITAPKDILIKLTQAKQGADLHSSTVDQWLVYDLCSRGILREHVKKIRRLYKNRRDLMLKALKDYMPEHPEIKWTRPQGGLFLWMSLPEKFNTYDLLEKAIEKKVAFVPGGAFYPGRTEGFNTLRLNFSNAKEDQIVEGIKRLGELIKEELNK